MSNILLLLWLLRPQKPYYMAYWDGISNIVTPFSRSHWTGAACAQCDHDRHRLNQGLLQLAVGETVVCYNSCIIKVRYIYSLRRRHSDCFHKEEVFSRQFNSLVPAFCDTSQHLMKRSVTESGFFGHELNCNLDLVLVQYAISWYQLKLHAK